MLGRPSFPTKMFAEMRSASMSLKDCRFIHRLRSKSHGGCLSITTLNTSWRQERPFSATTRTTQSASQDERSKLATKHAKIGIGFIGLGNMGLPMVQNLSKSSALFYDILVFDGNPVACERAAEMNHVKVAQSVEDLSTKSLIITMLPGDAAVDSVLEILHNLWLTEQPSKQSTSHDTSIAEQQQQRCVIDCSTVNPMTSMKWSKALQESRSAIWYDAPVSGGVKGATDGTLTFMLGGCSSLNQSDTQDGLRNDGIDVKFILEQMGSRVIECGSHVGAGAATKLCNNLALASQMIGISEAINLGESLGVDPVVLTSVLNISTAACWSSKVNNPHPKVAAATGAPAARDYQGGFATNLMLKDLGLAMQVATEKNVSLPLTATSKELYQKSAAQGKGLCDFGAVIQVLKEDRDDIGKH